VKTRERKRVKLKIKNMEIITKEGSVIT